MSLAKSYESPAADRSWKMRKFVADYGVYIALAILLLVGAVLTPKLYSVDTIAVVLRQASQLGIVAIGQTMVLLVAGLDLSVGGIFIMTSVVVAEVGNGRNDMVIAAIATAMALGGLVGLGNGLLVTKRCVPPFVATLGMLVLVKGATQAYTRGVPGGFVPGRPAHQPQAGCPGDAACWHLRDSQAGLRAPEEIVSVRIGGAQYPAARFLGYRHQSEVVGGYRLDHRRQGHDALA